MQKLLGENEVKMLGDVCEFKNGSNITKDKWGSSPEDLIKKIVEVLNKTDLVKLSIKNKVINNEALPTNKEVFNKLFIDDSGGRDDKNMKVINDDLFKRRILSIY